jgi:FlaA1/EpsC-like NDP-sugar epimerase
LQHQHATWRQPVINLWNRRFHNRYFFLTDIALLSCAAYLSFVLRLESWTLGTYSPMLGGFLTLALLTTLTIFYSTGIYRRYWPFASVDDLLVLSGSTAIASVIIGSLVIVGGHVFTFFPPIPRSVPAIFLLLALASAAGPRLLVRAMLHYQRHLKKLDPSRKLADQDGADSKPVQRVVVMGAGRAGTMVVRDLKSTAHLNVDVVGFLDDDPDKRHLTIGGVPVLGDRAAIPSIARIYGIQQLIIAMPSASGKTVREIRALCENAGVHTKVIPGIYELVDGKVHVNQIRDIQIEDLLRREPISIDMSAVRNLLKGKRVLVTGGGGSIGSELCRQVLRYNPSALIVVGHGENSVFEITNELRQRLTDGLADDTSHASCEIHGVIADIRFQHRIHTVLESYAPDIVFHAAAHKHVPLMENNPVEAISNNVQGTRNLLNAAEANNVERFVMISTDKAVNPTSIMGASKRVAELLVHQTAERSGRPYMAVRFGNVLGSRGSVVLTFKKQIAKGGPITVTHPDMCRYFMTIPEAVQLVLQAGTLGQGGEVFTLDMGEQIKIADLARDIIQLSGLKVGDDIDIVYSGLRPGEKLYEELFMPDETFQRTQHKKIFIAANASTFVPQELPQRVEMLIAASEHNDVMFVLDMLEQLIPQHQLEQVRQLHKVREVGAAPASAGEPSAPWALQSGEKLMARVVGA